MHTSEKTCCLLDFYFSFLSTIDVHIGIPNLYELRYLPIYCYEMHLKSNVKRIKKKCKCLNKNFFLEPVVAISMFLYYNLKKCSFYFFNNSSLPFYLDKLLFLFSLNFSLLSIVHYLFFFYNIVKALI